MNTGEVENMHVEAVNTVECLAAAGRGEPRLHLIELPLGYRRLLHIYWRYICTITLRRPSTPSTKIFPSQQLREIALRHRRLPLPWLHEQRRRNKDGIDRLPRGLYIIYRVLVRIMDFAKLIFICL